MRKSLVLFTVAVALAALPSAVAAGAGGGASAQVAGLQFALRAQGLYHGAIDAVSGPRTVAAVRKFQRIHHLRVTGIADARTRKALGPLGRPLFGARTLHRGNFGWDVAVLQFLLGRQGFRVPISAYFDGTTRHGVRLLQRRLHVHPDGVVGAHTLTAIARRTAVPLAPSHVRAQTRHATRHATRHTVSRRHYRKYVVHAGDTLSAIASRYGTTVTKLAKLNHLDPSRFLLVGTRLRIPATHHRIRVVLTAERTMSIASVEALLDHWSAHYGVDRHLVRGLAWMESGYNNRLVSKTGARGIMQIEPYTWRFVESVLIGHRVPHGPSGNIHVGVSYLRHLLGDFHGNTRKALAGWYQGEGAVRRHGMYKETRIFVKDVLAIAARR